MRNAEYAVNTGDLTSCSLCPNACRIPEGGRGRCLGRGRQQGQMVLFNYGEVVAGHLDPIEKKPLYHFYPGRSILSVGTYGCNLSCRFCQNCDISQHILEGEYLSPESLAGRSAEVEGNVGVAFTYNEPGIWFEYIMDCAPLIKQNGQKIVLVTNGYLSPEPWKKLCSVADAMNIDVKGFTDSFYRDVCGGKLDPVRKNVESALRAGVHVEVTNLVVTGKNTDPGCFSLMVDWLASLDAEIPLHISRYFPRHLETAPPTDLKILQQFHDLARQKLSHVFVGNAVMESGNHSLCPSCGAVWIQRHGYQTRVLVEKNQCACGGRVPVKGLGND